MLLSDNAIRKLCENVEKPMIHPFHGKSVKQHYGKKIASYGLSSGGYDISASNKFMILTPTKTTFWQRVVELFTGRKPVVAPIDYKNITLDMFESIKEDQIVVPPGGFLLALSEEHINMPRDVLALCIGKSTLARAGWNCLCTPLEPEWSGYITLEFQNTMDRPNIFYAREGCLQLVFLKMDDECETSYQDRGGKYQQQVNEIVLPKV